MKSVKQQMQEKLISSRQHIFENIDDISREERATTRLELSNEEKYNRQTEQALEERKHSQRAKKYQKVEFEDLDKYPKLKGYLEVISFIVQNGFSISMVGVIEDEFEIQFINNEENSIFEVNKYELVFLYFSLAVKKGLVSISDFKKGVIKLDANSELHVKKLTKEGTFKCLFTGLNNKIKNVELELQELLRLMFFEKEYVQCKINVPAKEQKISLYEKVFYNDFIFMYTIRELIGGKFKISTPVNIDEIEDYTEAPREVSYGELLDYDIFVEENLFKGSVEEFNVIVNDDEYREEIIYPKMDDYTIVNYVKERYKWFFQR